MVTRSGSAGTRWRGLALRDLLGRADWKCGTESVLRRGCASRCGTETVLQPRCAASRRGRSHSLEARDRDGPAAPFCGTVPSRLTGSLPPFHLCNTGSLLSIYVTIFHIPKSSAKIIFRVHRLPPFHLCNDSQIKCNDGAGRHGAAEWGCGTASVTRPLLGATHWGCGTVSVLRLLAVRSPSGPAGKAFPHSRAAGPTRFRASSLRDRVGPATPIRATAFRATAPRYHLVPTHPTRGEGIFLQNYWKQIYIFKFNSHIW